MTTPTVCRDAPAASSFASSRGSTVSDEDVPTMMSSSSLMSRTILKMLNPLSRATIPSTPKTKIAQVPQNVTISRPRLFSDPPPNCATVNAMPPNAPIGATHMISRMIPKITREATSKTPTICSRCGRGSIETAAAVRIAMTSTWRISLSTNGCTKLVGSRWPVMNETTPESCPASEIDSFAASRPAALTEPSKARAGLDDVRREQAQRQRDDGRAEEVGERPQREAAGAGEVAQRRDADHAGDEDHRDGHRLDEVDEGVGEPLGLLSAVGCDEAEDDPGGDRDEHPEPELGDEALMARARPFGRGCGSSGHRGFSLP